VLITSGNLVKCSRKDSYDQLFADRSKNCRFAGISRADEAIDPSRRQPRESLKSAKIGDLYFPNKCHRVECPWKNVHGKGA
jgi:hypothetical protein